MFKDIDIDEDRILYFLDHKGLAHRCSEYIREKYNIQENNIVISDIFENEFKCELKFNEHEYYCEAIIFNSPQEKLMFLLRFSP